MAKRAPASENIETDRVAGFSHPRETRTMIGQDAALTRAARAMRGGKPPQAWLLCGPPGVGKATLAYRIARYLLAHGARDTGAEDLSVSANDPDSLRMVAGAHPGLLVLKRGLNPDTGKLMNVLSVGEIRRLAGFFGMTSGAGGWRVAIVDTADDMNDNAANALLKLLEEPPSRAMLLLLSNTPGRLLPTIRSRCQRLELRPLDTALVERELARLLPDSNPGERASLARLSGGSIGAALQLASGESAELAAEADRLIDNARMPDAVALMALGDRIARMTDGLEMFGDFLIQALTARIRARTLQGGANLDCWTASLTKLGSLFARSGGLHLDPRQTLLGAGREIAEAARRAGPL
ncbi:MAG TPA: DNA polymerase III subunit delta' [Rhizomicrobium sp.]